MEETDPPPSTPGTVRLALIAWRPSCLRTWGTSYCVGAPEGCTYLVHNPGSEKGETGTATPSGSPTCCFLLQASSSPYLLPDAPL